MEQRKYEQTQKNHLGFIAEIRNLYLLQNRCQNAGRNKTSQWGFRYWIWKLVNLLQKTMKQGEWVQENQVKWVGFSVEIL